MVQQSLEGLSIAQAIKFPFTTSNTEAEYKVVFLELRLTKEHLVMKLELWCDPQLLASQLQG